MSHSLQKHLLDLFTKACQKAFETLPTEVPLEVARSAEARFGHYQFNSSMKLGQYFRQNPRKIAEAITQTMPSDSAIEKLEIAGPGFINVWLKKEYLQNSYFLI